MKGKHTQNKQKSHGGRFSKLAVVFILAQVFCYVWAHLYLSYKVGMEIAPVLSCAFLAFCGAEAGLLAMIKQSKIKNESGVTQYEGTDYSEADEP